MSRTVSPRRLIWSARGSIKAAGTLRVRRPATDFGGPETVTPWRTRASCNHSPAHSRNVRDERRGSTQHLDSGRPAHGPRTSQLPYGCETSACTGALSTTPTGGCGIGCRPRRRSGFPGLRFHDRRRANAAALFTAGIDLKTAQTRLGHSDPRLTLAVYAQATTATDRDAADHVAALFQARPAEAEKDGLDDGLDEDECAMDAPWALPRVPPSRHPQAPYSGFPGREGGI
jgi:hypothetical protein